MCNFFRRQANTYIFYFSLDDPLALFDKIYDKPWTRFGPYLIGMIVGWILFKTECKIPMKKVRPVLISDEFFVNKLFIFNNYFLFYSLS